MDFPQIRFPPLNVITPWSIEAGGSFLAGQDNLTWKGGSLSNLSGVANLAMYYPFRIFEPSTAVKMGVLNGTAVAGNIDVGIYDGQLNRVVNSGSTAQAGINSIQSFDITDTLLVPGLYYMALQVSVTGITSKVYMAQPAEALIASAYPCYVQAVGSFGLPATATFTMATDATNQGYVIPLMGVWFDTIV